MTANTLGPVPGWSAPLPLKVVFGVFIFVGIFMIETATKGIGEKHRKFISFALYLCWCVLVLVAFRYL